MILAWNCPDAFLETGFPFLSLADIVNWIYVPALIFRETAEGIEPKLYGIAASPLTTLNVYYWLFANSELTIL